MSSPLDPSEVNALMQAISDGRIQQADGRGAEDKPVVAYDLTSQDRIIRGQMPTLDAIDDRIASLFGGALAAQTRMDIRIMSTPSSLMKFSDVTALLSPPATVGLMTLGPGHGLAVVILDSVLSKALVAAAMGDRKARAEPPEEGARIEITNVERLVLRHLLSMLCEAMSASWSEILPLKPQMLRFESDPRMTIIAAPSDLVVMCNFEATGAVSGRLQIVIPYATVEPAKKMLNSPPRQSGPQDATFAARWARELLEVKVELRAELGRTRIPFAKLLELKVGDLLTLDQGESAPVPVLVQGRKKMTGVPRVVGGSISVTIEQGLRPRKPDDKPAAAHSSAARS